MEGYTFNTRKYISQPKIHYAYLETSTRSISIKVRSKTRNFFVTTNIYTYFEATNQYYWLIKNIKIGKEAVIITA